MRLKLTYYKFCHCVPLDRLLSIIATRKLASFTSLISLLFTLVSWKYCNYSLLNIFGTHNTRKTYCMSDLDPKIWLLYQCFLNEPCYMLHSL